jgi:uncharacterized membrane protein YphA (DoxX/SURF4 family)
MLDFVSSPYFVLFARLCVGGVFLASSAGKLLDREGTAAGMSRYAFLPIGSGRVIAGVLPWVELTVGLMLVLGVFTSLAALAATALFVVFTGFIAYDLTHDKNRSCHCFGRLSDEKVTPMAIVRNVVLALFAVAVALYFDGWLAVDTALGWGVHARNLPDTADAVPIALLALATVGAVVLGGQAVSMVRTTLRAMGFR